MKHGLVLFVSIGAGRLLAVHGGGEPGGEEDREGGGRDFRGLTPVVISAFAHPLG